MTTNIQCSGVSVAPRTLVTTRNKINRALESLDPPAERASLHIIDTNGPLLGGRDKACRIVVEISDGQCIVLEDRDYEVEPMLERLAMQLASEVRRKNQQGGLLSQIVKRAFQGIPKIRLQ